MRAEKIVPELLVLAMCCGLCSGIAAAYNGSELALLLAVPAAVISFLGFVATLVRYGVILAKESSAEPEQTAGGYQPVTTGAPSVPPGAE